MAVRAQEPEVAQAAVGVVTVDVIDVQDQGPTIPQWTNMTARTRQRNSLSDHRPSQQRPRWSSSVWWPDHQDLVRGQRAANIGHEVQVYQ